MLASMYWIVQNINELISFNYELLMKLKWNGVRAESSREDVTTGKLWNDYHRQGK